MAGLYFRAVSARVGPSHYFTIRAPLTPDSPPPARTTRPQPRDQQREIFRPQPIRQVAGVRSERRHAIVRVAIEALIRRIEMNAVSHSREA